MSEHTQVNELLPLYVSGGLDASQRVAVEEHVHGCAACQADLALWQAVAGEIRAEDELARAPQNLAERALEQVGRLPRQMPQDRAKHAPYQRPGLPRILQVLRSQMPLVNREIWPASALVIALGYIAALISEQAVFVYALAPLIAATCVSLIYGPENDPAYELALATPTSPRQILLARLLLVFGYNLGLVLVATLGMLPFFHQVVFGQLLLTWLAPMTFLSAAALAFSLWIGAPNAISITYTAWLAYLIAGPLRSPQAGLGLSEEVVGILAAYQGFWSAPAPLLALSVGLLGVAIWLAGRQERTQLHAA